MDQTATAAPLGAVLAPKPAFRSSSVVWIALMYCSTGLAEATSNFIMPDAIHRFTQNAFFISIILSLNPLFGFVAQPWAGWYSDRIWTPIGRRMPLILAGAGCLALSCIGLPFSQALADRMPWAAKAVAALGRPEVSLGLVVLSCWILLYQFVVDVISIMVRTIIGDLVPAKHRGKAFATANIVSVSMVFLTLRLGGAIAKSGEWKWYALVAAVSLACVLPATFFLKEPYVPPAKGEGKGRFRDYLDTVLGTPYFFRMCLVVACTFVGAQLITNYYRLFTKEQLGLGLEEALQAFSWMPIIAFFASYPIGWLSDRISPKYVTQAGAVLLALAGLVGVAADSLWDLRLMALLVGVGGLCVEVACNAYLIGFMPPDRIGQLSGFANIFRGGPRFLMFFGAGALIELFGRNYRIAFAGAIACGIVAFALLCFMPRLGTRPPDPA